MPIGSAMRRRDQEADDDAVDADAGVATSWPLGRSSTSASQTLPGRGQEERPHQPGGGDQAATRSSEPERIRRRRCRRTARADRRVGSARRQPRAPPRATAPRRRAPHFAAASTKRASISLAEVDILGQDAGLACGGLARPATTLVEKSPGELALVLGQRIVATPSKAVVELLGLGADRLGDDRAALRRYRPDSLRAPRPRISAGPRPARASPSGTPRGRRRRRRSGPDPRRP